MKLSDEQIRDTVAKLRMSEEHKLILIRQAIGGDCSARFAVFTHWKKQGDRENPEYVEFKNLF